MTKKKSSHLAASLLLAPALALGSVHAEAQKKTRTTVSRKTLHEAILQSRPQEAIRQAEALITQARRKHDFPLLLEAEEIRWRKLQELDPAKSTQSYQRLGALAKLPWLSPADRAALAIFELNHYLVAYLYDLDEEQVVRAQYDPVDPTEWNREQFLAFYRSRVEGLLKDLPLLQESLTPYQALFPQGQQEISEGRTLASELLYQLTYPATQGLAELYKQVLTALQGFAPESLPAYTASFIDQQLTIDRIRSFDRCAQQEAIVPELTSFLDRWGKAPIISNYYDWFTSGIPQRGLAKVRTLETFAKLATGLKKEYRERLQEEIRRARGGRLDFSAPKRLVGRRDFTLSIYSAYLVRQVQVSLYPAPKDYNPTQKKWDVAPDAKPLWSKELPLAMDSIGMLPDTVSLPLSLPEAGAYQLVLKYTFDKEARGGSDTESQYISSSDYVALEHKSLDTSTYQWLEAITGKPLAGATFQGYTAGGWNKPAGPVDRVQSDQWGRFTPERGELYHLAGSRDPLVVNNGDVRRTFVVVEDDGKDPQELSAFITADRPAYRPGQTAHFYGIASRIYRQAERAEVAAGQTFTAKIFDASDKEIHSQSVRTDSLGRFSLDFQLPHQGLTGRYEIRLSAQKNKQRQRGIWSTDFQVFEYKRSDSQLLLDTPQLPLSAGSQVTITGSLRTLSGSPIAGAKIQYALDTRRYYWLFDDDDEAQYDNQETPSVESFTTDAEGRFSIPLTLPTLKPGDEELADGKLISFPWYRYELQVTATDATGQVRTEQITLPAGPSVARVTPVLGTLLDKQAPELPLSFESKGHPDELRLTVRYSIQQDGRTLLTDSLDAWKKTDLAAQLRRLSPGRYELHYSTVFSDELTFSGKQAFYLFDSKKPYALKDLRAPLLLSAGSGQYSASSQPIVYWSSGLPGAYVFYDIYTGQGPLSSGLLRPEAGKINALPIDLSKLNELPEKITVRLWTVRDGRLIEQEQILERAQPKKTLAIHWQSFRDRLRAGEQESWRLSLRTPDGKPASGTAVAAWMYDSALDDFGSLPQWNPQLRLTNKPWGSYGNGFYRYVRATESQRLEPISSWYERWQAELPGGKFTGPAVPPAHPKIEIPSPFDDEGFYGVQSLFGVMDAEGAPARGLGGKAMARTVVTSLKLNSPAAARLAKAGETGTRSLLRTNFAENAFFLPQLTTDAKGEVSWSFTAPEQLSRWRLYILAHTRGMDHQTEVQTIQTFRPFSIRPALPRFLSEGDSLSLVTEVRNDSDQAQRGELILELFDPQSEAVLHREATAFDVPRGQSQAYSLPVTGFAGRDSVGVRIWARGAEASDGEQHLLPVRSARQRLTERLAFTRHITGRDSLILLPLLPKGVGEEALRDGQLSLQVSSHAAFFTLSALQGLSVSQDASAFTQATALYAQTLVQALRGLDGMKEWARARVENDPFHDLSKRPSLQQTPWARVSDQETQDELALARQLLAPVAGLESDRLLRQLEGLQDKQGLWSWYPGMRGSAYTTEAVLKILLRLPADRLEQAHRLRLSSLIKAGLSALEKELSEDYARFTSKKEPLADPFYKGISFLRLAAEGGRLGFFAPSEKAKPVTAYVLGRLKKEAHRLPLWQKPDVARILLSSGERKLAESLALSLREHLVTDETGSFFASLDASPYSWIDKTLPTITGTIQLLRLLGQGESPEIEGMTRWVINQKRTSSWANELVSADAIHALLLGEATSLTKGFSHVMVQVPLKDGMQLTAAGQTISTTLPLSELSHKEPYLAIEQDSPSIVWGSAVASYTVPTASVKHESGKEIRLQRETFLVREEGGKEMLLPLNDGHELRVGDRLRTRITIVVDRSLDFLRLEDPRTGFAEPITPIPGYAWGDGTGYYYEPKDQTTAFYIDHLTRGKYHVSYDQRVARSGVFLGGVTELVSSYAPEFGAHTAVASTQTVRPLSAK